MRVLFRSGSYRGVEIVSTPPPSSGGILLLQMLNVLEGWPMAELGFGSAASIHRLSETMRRAYADRFKHIADPAFHDVPMNGLIAKAYAAAIRTGIHLPHATPSTPLGPRQPAVYQTRKRTRLTSRPSTAPRFT